MLSINSDGKDTDTLIITKNKIEIKIDGETTVSVGVGELECLRHHNDRVSIDGCHFCLLWRESLSRWEVNIYYMNDQDQSRYWQVAWRKILNESNKNDNALSNGT